MAYTNGNMIKSVDWITIALYLLLVILGWFSICGASYDYGDMDFFSFETRAGKQLIWMGCSIVLGFVLLMLEDMLRADTVAITVAGKRYAFSVTAEVFEYDGIYQEDYAICLTDAGLSFLKALAQQKKDDPIPVEFLVEDEVRLSGVVVIPGDDAAKIYDLYIDLGGKTQELKSIDDLWPVKVTK